MEAKVKSDYMKGTRLVAFGIFFLIIFGCYEVFGLINVEPTYRELSWFWAIFIVLFSFMIYRGFYLCRFTKLFKRYDIVIRYNPAGYLPDIAESLGISTEVLQADLIKMIKRGYFDGYIDAKTNCIIMSYREKSEKLYNKGKDASQKVNAAFPEKAMEKSEGKSNDNSSCAETLTEVVGGVATVGQMVKNVVQETPENAVEGKEKSGTVKKEKIKRNFDLKYGSVTLVCPNCGATNKIEGGKIGECEYCGSSLEDASSVS